MTGGQMGALHVISLPGLQAGARRGVWWVGGGGGPRGAGWGGAFEQRVGGPASGRARGMGAACVGLRIGDCGHQHSAPRGQWGKRPPRLPKCPVQHRFKLLIGQTRSTRPRKGTTTTVAEGYAVAHTRLAGVPAAGASSSGAKQEQRLQAAATAAAWQQAVSGAHRMRVGRCSRKLGGAATEIDACVGEAR